MRVVVGCLLAALCATAGRRSRALPGATASPCRRRGHRARQGPLRADLPRLSRRGPARRRHGWPQPAALAAGAQRQERRVHRRGDPYRPRATRWRAHAAAAHERCRCARGGRIHPQRHGNGGSTGRPAARASRGTEPARRQCARGRNVLQGGVRGLPFTRWRSRRHRHAPDEHRAAAEQLGRRPARRGRGVLAHHPRTSCEANAGDREGCRWHHARRRAVAHG